MTKTGAIKADSESFTQELQALKIVLNALSPLSEDERTFVFRTAAERLKVSGVPLGGQPPPYGTGTGRASTGSDSLEGVNPKEFLRLKKPTSELQRMVCLAFYLTNARSKPHFKTVDLTTLNTEAAGGKFSNASATVNNATLQSHFLAPAGKGGLKQITALGEDYVRALPDQEAARAVVLSHKAPRRKGARKTSTKKE